MPICDNCERNFENLNDVVVRSIPKNREYSICDECKDGLAHKKLGFMVKMNKTKDCPNCGWYNSEYRERCLNCDSDLSDVDPAYH